MSSRRGVLLLILAFTVVGTLILFAAIRLRGPSPVSGGGTVLVLDVPYQLGEGDAPARPFAFGFRGPRWHVRELVEGIDQAADDHQVRALVLHVEGLAWGWAKAHEVRDAILRFRESGKPVYASFEEGGDLEYLLASAADVVSMPPAGVIYINGLSASATFMRGTLDKLDVSPNFVRAGAYKSAIEEYTRTGFSPEARHELEEILDDEYSLLVDSLASARGYASEDVRRVLDAGPFTGDDALSLGLVDTLLYDADVDSMALDQDDEAVTTTDFDRYADRISVSGSGPRIALITAAGTILTGKSYDVAGDDQILGSETMVEALREARTRSAIKAVVLRIDSPGGDVRAADDIWAEVDRLSREKPVIVSMSDVAASGGYYIAAPAKRIVAQPATITGSIGVFGGKLNILGLYRKVGLNVETVTRGSHAEMMSPFRDFTPDERDRYQAQIDATYRLFLKRVAAGRGLSLEAVDSVGQGRIWSGLDALEVGLVDTLGGLETAIALAREAGGLERHHAIERLPRVERRWYERWLDDLIDGGPQRGRVASWLGRAPSGGDARAALEAAVFPAVVRAWITASRLPGAGPWALLPVSIEIR